jgi:hypothetical protein
MLQVFHTYVAKVDLDVAYVAMPIHACFNRIFQVFYLFQMYVANTSKVDQSVAQHRWLANSGLPQLPIAPARA